MGRPKLYFSDEERKDAHNKKRHTPTRRAKYLIDNYNYQDKFYNRGKGDLTAQWLMDNIIFKPCAHCGKADWTKIGCNRLDNTKPHTMDNVEPCCAECNVELIHPKKRLDQIDKITGEVIRTWNSYMDARRAGFTHAEAVSKGERKQDKGFVFKYINRLNTPS